MPTAVAYLRVSKSEQDKGLEVQRRAIRQWAERHGIALASEHVDQGVSGGAKLGRREGLMDALVGLEPGGVLVVHRRDRLARDVAVVVALEHEIKRKGCTIAAVEGGANGDGPEAQFMRRILDAVAEFERELIRARTRAVKRLLKRQGRKAGSQPPYGYAHAGGLLVPDPAEFPVREQILAWKAEGLSLRGTVAELDRAGIPAREGRWLPEKVRRVLLYRPAD